MPTQKIPSVPNTTAQDDTYIAEATVEKLVFGGMGLLRDENIGVCFVSDVLPGERIRFQVVCSKTSAKLYTKPSEDPSTQTTPKRSFQNAELLEILEASPNRVQPKCLHYKQCGACDWQHIDYAAQQNYKAQIVLENLQRLSHAHITNPTVSNNYASLMKACIAEPNHKNNTQKTEETKLAGWAYRQRAKLFPVRTTPGNWGFRRKASCQTLAIPQCQILVPAIREQLSLPSTQKPQHKISLAQNEKPNSAVHVFASDPSTASCTWEKQEFSYKFQNIVLKSQARLFFQSNAKVLPLLLAELQTEFQRIANNWQHKLNGKPGAFFDLYAGVGLFSSCFAQLLPKSSQCHAVERNPNSFHYLQQNLSQWHFSCHNQDVGTFLKKISTNQQNILETSIVFADPSRGGLSPTVSRLLNNSKIEYIFYLSCDAASFARDYGRLCQTYQMESWRLVDFYPQTHHIEVLALLHRKTAPKLNQQNSTSRKASARKA